MLLVSAEQLAATFIKLRNAAQVYIKSQSFYVHRHTKLVLRDSVLMPKKLMSLKIL